MAKEKSKLTNSEKLRGNMEKGLEEKKCLEEKNSLMEKNGIEDVEIIISKSLKIGVLASAIVILIGFLMFLITGRSGYAGSAYPTALAEIFKGLVLLKPYAIILTGLFILILTPVFRVGVSVIVFLKEKDYLYVGITILVFVILIISFLLGKVE
ncbi:Uncharacterized membrane protein [Anaerocolumna jejuensis DSM 15929]|uniref:Uncharacterized membrane protein n=1 Tax=Anaerocolumna jejuensis DSM 15929 TaxID=1121322 RepID=A0A1M6NPM8_9FIRM|nr:DUF1634 domain-containing protein [Anaerocolumna jejuensis]SHJ97522.1 Uncharacterized membrane protein [Anaerocolumna jejuensis DSM 15929]